MDTRRTKRSRPSPPTTTEARPHTNSVGSISSTEPEPRASRSDNAAPAPQHCGLYADNCALRMLHQPSLFSLHQLHHSHPSLRLPKRLFRLRDIMRSICLRIKSLLRVLSALLSACYCASGSVMRGYKLVKVACHPVFSRSTNLESKLIDFFVLLK